MIKLTWCIEQVDRNTEDDMVFGMWWRLVAIDETDGFEMSTTGEFGFKEIVKNENSIPYSDLSEQTLVSWLKGTMGPEVVEMYEVNLLKKIEMSRNNTYGIGVPWIKE